jgi:hypothetical protein
MLLWAGWILIVLGVAALPLDRRIAHFLYDHVSARNHKRLNSVTHAAKAGHWLGAAVLALIVVLNTITAGQRFVKVWKQATADTPALSDRRRRRPRAGRSTSQRWAERRASRPASSRRRPGGSA